MGTINEQQLIRLIKNHSGHSIKIVFWHDTKVVHDFKDYQIVIDTDKINLLNESTRLEVSLKVQSIEFDIIFNDNLNYLYIIFSYEGLQNTFLYIKV